MPEYLPAPQLPTGLAEQMSQIQLQKGKYLMDALNSMGDDWSKVIQQRANRISPEQFQSLTNPTQSPMTTPGLFPRGITPAMQNVYSQSQALAERKYSSEEATTRALGAANIHAKSQEKIADEKLKPIPVNDIHKQQYQMVYGHPMPDIITELRPDQQKQLADSANKIIEEKKAEKVAGLNAASKQEVERIKVGLQSTDAKMRLQSMKDRDAYVTKHPNLSAAFGVPDEVGKPGNVGGGSEETIEVTSGGKTYPIYKSKLGDAYKRDPNLTISGSK